MEQWNYQFLNDAIIFAIFVDNVDDWWFMTHVRYQLNLYDISGLIKPFTFKKSKKKIATIELKFYSNTNVPLQASSE